MESSRQTEMLIAFDLETTGLSFTNDRIVEIAAVRFTRAGQVIDTFEQLVNPERPMPPRTQAIHGIGDADLINASTAREVLPKFLDYLGDAAATILLAHNASFDAGFLGQELARAGHAFPDHRIVDTLALARRRRPELISHRLQVLAQILGLEEGPAHRALADSFLVKSLWLRLDGGSLAEEHLTSYPIHDPRTRPVAPNGWSILDDAIAQNASVRIEYDGGTKGAGPRSITPRRFLQKGGTTYVVAFCHLGMREKSFRLDRIRSCLISPVPAVKLAGGRVDLGGENR